MPAPHPRMHGNTHVPGGADPIPVTPGSSDAIRYEVDPQEGSWLHIETTEIYGGGPTGHGIRLLADLGDIELNAVDHDIEMITGNDVLVFGGRDVIWSADRDCYINTDRDIHLVAQGEVLLQAVGSYIKLYGLPTSDPGVSNAVWNDSGTLKISP